MWGTIMNYIYLNTIEKFVNTNPNNILETFKINFRKVYGESPDIEQVKAWESSINYLQEALDDQSIYGLTVSFEYKLPFSSERIDLLIFGKNKSNKPTILLFELKGWKKATKTTSPYIVNYNFGKSVHPEYQVKNYAGKIRFSHSESDNFDIITSVLMYNSTPDNIKLDFEGHVFFKNDINSLRNFISRHLTYMLEPVYIYRFLNGQYIQSKKLFDAIKRHFKDIQKQSYLTLAENGWGLSSEQLELIEEIIKKLKSNENNIVYLVQGAPGSGKTLVAIHLLLSALAQGHQTLLAYRNNRLIYSIRDIFNSIKYGLSNPIKFYSTGRPRSPGVAEANFDGFFEIVIYDEAQRMTEENIRHALQRGRITVFFYDEDQILNAEEHGTTENFKREAQKQGKIIKERFLQGFYRVEGGEQYHKFVELLLKAPEKINCELTRSWKNSYDFKIFESFEELLSSLRKRIKENFKVALIAAFTESPGDLHHSTSLRNLRIGYHLYSGLDIYKNLNKKIYWLMDPKNDYVPFWVKGESNKLEKCASIYGCQGFETDFAGVIWGRDFVFRNGKWELGEKCEDNTGKPSLKNLIDKAKNGNSKAYNLALNFLINRYRIFLTRGIKGTYIFCEDSETAAFLSRIWNEFVS